MNSVIARTISQLTFTVMKANTTSNAGELAAAQARCQSRRSKRILMVDGDMFILQINAAVLSSFGYQTRVAVDGAAAWEALQANGYDLLITDNNIPKVSGVELVRKVRSAQMTLPVILASRDLPALKLEANAWLQPVVPLRRPFTDDALLGTVKKVLRDTDCGACEQNRVAANLQPRKIRPPSALRIQPGLSLATLVH